jgi:RimJ/RimL family protein N-acetyltransferase
MLEPSRYSAVELLPGGCCIEIRALRSTDRPDLLAAIHRSSPQSLYRRFFSPKRGFTEREIAYFLDVDFTKHVALVATQEEDGQRVIVGGGRYIVIQPGTAEIAFVVVDRYQGLGIGAALMCHLAAVACAMRIEELRAEVLADNLAMLGVFKKSGLPMRTVREGRVIHVALRLSDRGEVAPHV